MEVSFTKANLNKAQALIYNCLFQFKNKSFKCQVTKVCKYVSTICIIYIYPNEHEFQNNQIKSTDTHEILFLSKYDD